jgi:hypothetical protein
MHQRRRVRIGKVRISIGRMHVSMSEQSPDFGQACAASDEVARARMPLIPISE